MMFAFEWTDLYTHIFDESSQLMVVVVVQVLRSLFFSVFSSLQSSDVVFLSSSLVSSILMAQFLY